MRLRQILWNLIGNAIKFTHQDSIVLRIAKEDSSIVLEVEDTGIGISATDRKKLFRPFSQGDESMTRKFGGTGLGLALSKRLAELLGGSLELKVSEVGKGSTFRVVIKNLNTGHYANTPKSFSFNFPS